MKNNFSAILFVRYKGQGCIIVHVLLGKLALPGVFARKINPLNVEFSTQAKNFPVVLPGYPNQNQGYMSYTRISKQTYTQRLLLEIFTNWEPSVALATHNYSHRFTRNLGRKITILAIFPYTSGPTQLKISKPSWEDSLGSPVFPS